jgi:hypothetical protein
MSEEPVTKGEFAKLIGVSGGRVSQWIAQKKLFGDAIVGEGQRARIRVSVALRQIDRTVDLDRRLGAGGKALIEDAPSGIEKDIKQERLRSLKVANSKADLELGELAGVYVRADAERREFGRILQQHMSMFEGALAALATAIAAKSNLPYRDGLFVLRDAFHEYRVKMAASVRELLEAEPLHEEGPEAQ